MKLILPAENFKQSFLQMMEELAKEGNWDYASTPEQIKKDFPGYLRKLREAVRGQGLPEGWVPATEYWIYDAGQIVGHLPIRHKLNPALETFGGHIGYSIRPSERKKGYASWALAASLPIAAKLGIERALLTCEDGNAASIRVIERCGGVLQDKIDNPQRAKPTRRYWIDLRKFR